MSDGRRIGFLGVGLMGHGAAKNILERGGYPLTILGHRNREPVDDLIARGAREAADPAALAEASDVVITCVPSSVEVEAAFHGPRGLLAGARKGMIFIDATTADPASTRKIGAELAAIGCHLVDAALGRTPKEAEAGKLSTYVGGDPKIIEKVRPILASYADTIVVCGPLGAGTTCKLVNNSITIGMSRAHRRGFRDRRQARRRSRRAVRRALGRRCRRADVEDDGAVDPRGRRQPSSRARSASAPRTCAPMGGWRRTPAWRPSSRRRSTRCSAWR